MAVPALTSTPSLLQGEDSTGRVSRGSGAQSAAGAGSGKEGLGGGPAALLGRGHTLRGSQGPTPEGTAVLQGQTALHSHPARPERAHGPGRRQGGVLSSARGVAGLPERKNPKNAA